MLVAGIALVATDPGDKVEERGAEDASPAAPSLSLLAWIGPALVCASAYAFYNIFIKKGSASINPILGGVVLQFVAALFGTILLVILSIKEGGTCYLNYDKWGLIWSCLAGIAVGTAEMVSFVVSGLGVPATQSIPIIIGGTFTLTMIN
jgi:transporter family protein